MSKKTTTKTDQTVTPINPTQVTNGLTGFADKITGLQNTDPYSFTTGANPLQTQAGGLAGTIGMYDNEAGATMNSDYDKAMATASSLGTMGSGPGARALSYMNDYMNPYTDSVVNTSLADFDKNAGRQQAQATLDAAQDTSWGGSGYGIAKSLLTRELNDGRASLDSGLRSQGFTTALGAGQADASNEMQQRQIAEQAQAQAAALQAQIASGRFGNTMDFDANNRANVGTQMQAGDDLRQIDLQHGLAPLTSAAAISGLWGSTPFNLMTGQHTTGTTTSKTSDPVGTIAGIAGGLGSLATGLGGMGLKFPGAAAAASDRRLKRDIEHVETLDNGLDIYRYRYLWDDVPRLGVMADEVQKVDPNAVFPVFGDYLGVDYGRLGLAHLLAA
jgi:hypothetical protein